MSKKEQQDVAQQLVFDNVSPATRLLEKRRQMYEVQEALEDQTQKYAAEEEKFKKQEEALRSKDLYLQQQLIRFNKFLQDNEAKRRRAETRAAEESAQIKQREIEISELEEQQRECKQQCGQLEQEVARNMQYEEFLERVKEASDDYAEVQELIGRYETLDAANADLRATQAKYDHKNEALRSEYQAYTKEKSLEILALQTKTASLQHELDAVQKEHAALVSTIDDLTQEESGQSLFLGQILYSADNLWQRCASKRPAIQHKAAAEEDEKSKKKDNDENEDSDKKVDSGQAMTLKCVECVKQLQIVQAYLKDFRFMADEIKKDQRMRVKPQNDEAITDYDLHAEIVTVSEKEKESMFDTQDSKSKSNLGGGATRAQ